MTEVPDDYKISEGIFNYIERWTLTHDTPNKTLLVIAGWKGKDSYTPNEILAEIKADSPVGRFIAFGLEKTLEENRMIEEEATV